MKERQRGIFLLVYIHPLFLYLSLTPFPPPFLLPPPSSLLPPPSSLPPPPPSPPPPLAHPPLQLVQNCADHYLTSEHKSIRMEAVRTCASLLVPNLLPPTIFTTPFAQFSAASAQLVGEVVGKLLTVGITDQGKRRKNL